jgi:hypothetical protein
MTEAEVLGADLRQARLDREIALLDAEKATRIRAYYLEALENGHFEVLPSPVQARGFLRNYARFLGLDADEMAERFDQALTGRRGRSRVPVASPPPTPTTPKRRAKANRLERSGRVINSDYSRNPTGYTGTGGSRPSQLIPPPDPVAIPPSPRTARSRVSEKAVTDSERRERRRRQTTLGTTLILGISLLTLLGLIGYSVVSDPILMQSLNLPTLSAFNAPNTATPSLGTPTLANAPTLEIITPDPALESTLTRPTPLPNPNTQAAPSTGSVTLQLTVKERAFVRVFIDNAKDPVYSGYPAPESLLQYVGNSTIRLAVDNAGGVELTVNGVPQGELGMRKQSFDKTYTASDGRP